MDKRLERILPRVQKPARYVGGEYNAVVKDLSQVDTRIAFCFPDTYEIGMSNLGMRAGVRPVGGHGGGDARGAHAAVRAGIRRRDHAL